MTKVHRAAMQGLHKEPDSSQTASVEQKPQSLAAYLPSWHHSTRKAIGWSRGAMDRYREWERKTGSVTGHDRKQAARKSILGNLKIKSFSSLSLLPPRVSVLRTEQYETVQRDSNCA